MALCFKFGSQNVGIHGRLVDSERMYVHVYKLMPMTVAYGTNF
jgi:hypothetical protein